MSLLKDSRNGRYSNTLYKRINCPDRQGHRFLNSNLKDEFTHQGCKVLNRWSYSLVSGGVSWGASLVHQRRLTRHLTTSSTSFFQLGAHNNIASSDLVLTGCSSVTPNAPWLFVHGGFLELPRWRHFGNMSALHETSWYLTDADGFRYKGIPDWPTADYNALSKNPGVIWKQALGVHASKGQV